jgi:hypothetical protein
LDWPGELAGDWRVDELLDELDELVPEELVPEDEVPDVPDVPDEVDELLSDDDPESLTEACVVAPGRAASTAPATATLAKDAATVVAVSRRLPCSRSATARASWRAASRSSRLSMSTSLPWRAEGPVRARSENPLSPPSRPLLADPRLESWGNAQRSLHRRLPGGS